MKLLSWLGSVEGVLRVCEITAVAAGILAVGALVGKDFANRIIRERKARETLELQRDVAEARSKQAEAERLLLEVKERVRPRRLKDDQGEKLLRFLKDRPKSRVDILYPVGNNEAFNLANDIYMQALMGSGWQVNAPRPDQEQRPWSELRVEAATIDQGTPAEFLRQGLVSVGIPCAAARNDKVPEGSVILFIGPPFAKPFSESH